MGQKIDWVGSVVLEARAKAGRKILFKTALVPKASIRRISAEASKLISEVQTSAGGLKPALDS
jgi:hypothetical protein